MSGRVSGAGVRAGCQGVPAVAKGSESLIISLIRHWATVRLACSTEKVNKALVDALNLRSSGKGVQGPGYTLPVHPPPGTPPCCTAPVPPWLTHAVCSGAPKGPYRQGRGAYLTVLDPRDELDR